jgi:hypothetical protein
MKHLRITLLAFLIGVVTLLSIKIYTIEQQRRKVKEDLIELSMIKYGLFSVDEWKQILATIITKKVNELNFTGENREAMRKKISALLYKVVDDFEARYYQKNASTFKGFLKNIATSAFGAFDNIRKDVPKFTEQIIDFLDDPANKKAIQSYVVSKLNEYADNSFSKIDYTTHNAILKKYEQPSREAAMLTLSGKIESLNDESKPFKVIVLVMAIVVVTSMYLVKEFSRLEYVMLIAISLALLITGLLLPMLEIDARIASMKFTLLGEDVTFTDQVLYYKSKSILEVVSLMFQQSRADILVVGILVLVFSVLFPIAKQIASLVYVFNKSSRNYKAVRFMVFKTGKWSMADVMVIAILMSYIGFSGIITEQLKQIETIASSLEILTTNKSSLLAGFFFFCAFAIFSLSISQKIELQFNRNEKSPDNNL